MSLYDIFLKGTYWVLLPFTFILYLLEPFNNDVFIYLGAAKVTALTTGFPMSLDAVWETRYIGSRFIFYCLNLIDPFHGFWYMIWMKCVVAAATIAILYYFSKRISEKMQVPFDWVFITGFLGLFAISAVTIFSSEYLSVVIAMLMLTMILDDRNWCQVLSGLLILPLLLIKGLPVLLVLIVMLAVVMLVPDYIDRFKAGLISVPFVEIILLGMIFYFPHFISDLWLAKQLTVVLNHMWYESLIYFLIYGVSGIIKIPMIVISAFVLIGILNIVPRDRAREFILILLMWVVASAYTLIIGEFWYYHYYLMLIPAVFTVSFFLKMCRRNRSDIVFPLIVVAVLVSFVILFTMNFGLYNQFNHEVEAFDAIAANTDILSQPTTLYLDDGGFSFFLPTRSACRYVGATPYQRSLTMNPVDLTKVPAYWEERNCALAYTGKYVVISPHWFNMTDTTHKEMIDKLNTEYTVIYPNICEIGAIYQRK